MLSIGAMKSGQESYYQNLAREDYFLEGGEPPGRWLGKGAITLGLAAKVNACDLKALFRGFSSDGRPLVQNAGKENRQPGWDLTFSAPKSVSVLWSQAEEFEQREIQAAHADAVTAAISLLESHHAFSRVGKGGLERIKVALAVAAFEHSSSRALDPQLHTHCLVMNLGVDDAGHVRSLLSKPLYEAKMLAGAFYRAELAYQLQQRLGVEVDRPTGRDGKPASWFEIKGVPEQLLKHFSKRRAEIEKELGARGLESASAAAFATLATRDAKSIVPPRTVLHATWRKEGQVFGFLPESVLNVRNAQPLAVENYVARAVGNAAEQMTYGENFFSEDELLRQVLEASSGCGIAASEIAAKTRDELYRNSDFHSLGAREGKPLWTTEEVIRIEGEFLESVAALKARDFKGVAGHVVKAALEKERGEPGSTFKLDCEQQAAVRYIAEGKESIKVVSGFAGTGKTDMLAAAKEALEAGGYRVIGTALAGVAARTLQEKAGIESKTVRARELQLYPSLKHQWTHHARQLVRAAMGMKTYKLEPLAIDAQTVLVIDEAGMVGTRDFALLARAVVERGGSIVAIGDEKQLSSIERGGAFAKLVRDIRGVRLTEIRRQVDESDRAAVKDLAGGNPEAALIHYSSKGQLCVARSRSQAEHELMADWTRHGGAESPAEHKMFAGTRAEVDRLNRLAQWERVKAGQVRASERVEHDSQTFMVGDRVRFNTSLRTRGIEKGRGGTVIAVKDGLSGRYVAVSLRDDSSSLSERALVALKHHATQLIRAAIGKKTERLQPRSDVVLVPLKSVNPLAKTYAGLSLDYAMTTHLGQGQTVKNAYVLLGGRMGDRELSYVQGSRHKEALRLYTSEVEAGRQITAAARLTRPVDEHFETTNEEIPDYSSLVMQMKLSRAKELASEVQQTPTLSHEEHQYAH